MDKRSSVVIHANHLPNQHLYAGHLLTGFKRLGFTNMKVTGGDGDIHVCIGPWHAYKECIGKKTIYIDRCLWGDALDYVTIGWLNDQGGMVYPTQAPADRPKPRLLPWVDYSISKALVALDYGPYPLEDCDEIKRAYGADNVTLRPHPTTVPNHHPATNQSRLPLPQQLPGHGVVIGYRTSALVTAVIAGYPIICLDKRSPAHPVAGHDILDIVRPDRKQWLNNMSYAQWAGSEIRTGEALQYVIDSYNTAYSRTTDPIGS